MLEKKPNSKSKTIPLLKFPQLSVCYQFNYSNYDFTSKKITYSVLTSDQTKLEIPIKQIKIKSKNSK